MGEVASSRAIWAGRYEQHEQIGSGGLARIYAGWDRVARREVAIKELEPAAIEALRREGIGLLEPDALTRCLHPGVLRLIDFLDETDRIALITERVPGRNLEEILTPHPLPLDDFFPVALQILGALRHIHRRGWLHCDLKPENIMVFRTHWNDLRVKVIDFGQARPRTSPFTVSESGKREIFATPEFVAPELIQGEPFTPATDLYAVGHILYHALAGRPAFEHEEVSEVLRSHLEGHVPDIRSVRPDVPPSLAAWLQTLTHRAPMLRPRSADTARRSLLWVALGHRFRRCFSGLIPTRS